MPFYRITWPDKPAEIVEAGWCGGATNKWFGPAAIHFVDRAYKHTEYGYNPITTYELRGDTSYVFTVEKLTRWLPSDQFEKHEPPTPTPPPEPPFKNTTVFVMAGA